jgi:hypothetical protein
MTHPKTNFQTLSTGENKGGLTTSPSGKLASVAREHLAAIEDPDVKAAVKQFLHPPPSNPIWRGPNFFEPDHVIPDADRDLFPPIKAVRNPSAMNPASALRESAINNQFDFRGMSPEYYRSPPTSTHSFIQEPTFEEFPIGPHPNELDSPEFTMTEAEEGVRESKRPPISNKKSAKQNKVKGSPKARKSILKRPFSSMHF